MKNKINKILTIFLTIGLLISLTACKEKKIKAISFSLTDKYYELVVNRRIKSIDKIINDSKEAKKQKEELIDTYKKFKDAKCKYIFDEKTQKLAKINIYIVMDKDLLSDGSMEENIKNINTGMQALETSIKESVGKDKKLKKYKNMNFDVKLSSDGKKENYICNITIDRMFIKCVSEVSDNKEAVKELKKYLNCDAKDFKDLAEKETKKNIIQSIGKKDCKDCYKISVEKY